MPTKIKSTSGREYCLYNMGGEDITIIFDWEFDIEDGDTHIIYYFFGDADFDLIKVVDDYETMDRLEYLKKYGMF